MRIPIISKLWQHRAGPQNSLWGSTYSFFFGSTTSGQQSLQYKRCLPKLIMQGYQVVRKQCFTHFQPRLVIIVI